MKELMGSLSSVFPALGARWGNYLWYRTQKPALSVAEKSLMQDAQVEYLRIANTSVPVYRFPAEGPRLLLVHGWGGRASHFSFVIHRLRRLNFDIVTFDAPGHGLAPGRRSNFYEFTQAVSAVGQANAPIDGIIAHSAGGLCALSSIATGLATQKLACINPVFSLNDLLFGHFSEKHGIPQSIAKRVERKIEQRFGASIWPDFDGAKRLSQLNLPVLFMHDADDPITPIASWLPHQQNAPNLMIEKTQGLGHHGGLLDKKTLSKLVDFFSVGEVMANAS